MKEFIKWILILGGIAIVIWLHWIFSVSQGPDVLP